MQKRFAGKTETQMTAEGRRQVKQAAQDIKELNIDYIITSPSLRTLESAIIIAKEIGYPPDQIHTNSLLFERNFGALEGQPWNPDIDIDGISDVETIDNLLTRGRMFLVYAERLPAKNILVVSHGQIGRAIRHHIVQEFPFDYVNLLENAKIHQWI